MQHFFVCRLGELDWSARTGDEYSNPERGGYDLDYIDLTDDSLSSIGLKPAALKELIAKSFLLVGASSLAGSEYAAFRA